MGSLTTLPAHDFLKKAASVASYYGFAPLDTLVREKIHPTRKQLEMIPLAENVRRDPLGDIAALMLEKCLMRGAIFSKTRDPLLFYHVRPPQRTTSGKKRVRFSLAVVGSQKSIGEALIIKSALTILEEVGIKDATVHLNSIGDKDSIIRFSRELTNYLRRHANDLPIDCQQAMKEDVFEALEIALERGLPLCEYLPRPLQFLSETSRRHFREVIEFLEADDIPYLLEDRLIGHRECYSQTLFEIRSEAQGGATLVRGGRCDEIAKKNFKSNIPFVGAVFEYETSAPSAPVPLSRPAKFFLIQLGFNAKLLSLSVLEQLRKAHIPVSQTINNDNLREQLEYARIRNIPYLIIMGQREALDRTVIIRNMASQAQEIVPIHMLPRRLKSDLRL